jgi:flagellin-like protein
MKGISAIIATLMMLLITMALAGMAYMYISGVFTSKTRVISLQDAFCVGTTGSVIVRNEGPDTIRAGEQTLVPVDESCTKPSMTDIPQGSTVRYDFTDCGTNRFHSYRLIGPSNSIEIRFRCS